MSPSGTPSRTQRVRQGLSIEQAQADDVRRRRDAFTRLVTRYYEMGARRRLALEPRIKAESMGLSPTAVAECLAEAARRAKPR